MVVKISSVSRLRYVASKGLDEKNQRKLFIPGDEEIERAKEAPKTEEAAKIKVVHFGLL